MMVSAALIVSLSLVIPTATGSDAQGAETRSVATPATQPLATRVSPAPDSTPTAGRVLHPTEDRFQAFAVEDDLKVSPKKRAAPTAGGPSRPLPTGKRYPT